MEGPTVWPLRNFLFYMYVCLLFPSTHGSIFFIESKDTSTLVRAREYPRSKPGCVVPRTYYMEKHDIYYIIMIWETSSTWDGCFGTEEKGEATKFIDYVCHLYYISLSRCYFPFTFTSASPLYLHLDRFTYCKINASRGESMGKFNEWIKQKKHYELSWAMPEKILKTLVHS